MSKKVDVSFMKLLYSDDDWQREIVEGGDKLLCSESARAGDACSIGTGFL